MIDYQFQDTLKEYGIDENNIFSFLTGLVYYRQWVTLLITFNTKTLLEIEDIMRKSSFYGGSFIFILNLIKEEIDEPDYVMVLNVECSKQYLLKSLKLKNFL